MLYRILLLLVAPSEPFLKKIFFESSKESTRYDFVDYTSYNRIIIKPKYFTKIPFQMCEQQIIVRQAAVHRCNATVEFHMKGVPFLPVTVNDERLHDYFNNVAGDMLGRQNIKVMELVMGSEDFAFFSDVIPGYFFFLGMNSKARGPVEPPHSPHFTINENALPYGAALHASLVTRYLLEFRVPSPAPEEICHGEF